MEKLLKWSISANSQDEESKKRAGQPDPELLAQLFGGPDEPTLMNESMKVINNPETDLENKEVAFDNFEMLIENMDNANNIENMHLWPPLLQNLDSEYISLRRFACSCIGTAVQNNPKCQEHFLKHSDGIKKLIAISSNSEEDDSVKLKALYALSNVLRHNKPAYEEFSNQGGWNEISPLLTSLDNSNEKIKLRTLSLLSSIITNGLSEEVIEHLHNNKVVISMLKVLKAEGHITSIDKVLSLLTTLVQNKFRFSDEEINLIRQSLTTIAELEDSLNNDDLNTINTFVKVEHIKQFKRSKKK
ncbi:GQ67_00067T0 [Komagataella phaffii]|nr:GQ67_00067T0 [Komagataella phaffii]AOA67184.1 GQ68_01320T0 [Komagataella phaffii GS115]